MIMATCRQCAYLRKCIDKATKGGYEHNVDFDPKDGCPGWGFKSNTAADTNADRIRAMSDEELAKFLEEASWICANQVCRKCPLSTGTEICKSVKEWLKQPVEE
jgi:hypothetical protein